MSVLDSLASEIASGGVRIVDLTHDLTPDFPVMVLPPEFGQCQPFRMEEVSRYDARGPAWYWNNISMSEHAGTHFDAPAHWVSGRQLPNGTVDSLPLDKLIAPVCVLDFSAESAADRDFLLTRAHVEAWEADHGAIARAIGCCYGQTGTSWSEPMPIWGWRRTARTRRGQTPTRSAFWSKNAGSSVSAPRRSAPMQVRALTSHRPILRTTFFTVPVATGCNASQTSTSYPPKVQR